MPPDARGDCGDWQLECGQLRERGARLLASAQWADCSFLVGAGGAGGARGVPVRAHRLILAMASPVFQAMFYGPVAEGDAPIPVPDIQPDVFTKLLQYVYTDDVDLEDYTIAFEVYYAAEKYMLPHLQTLCTAYLAGKLVPQNACGIYEFANFIDDKKLEDDSLKVIKDNTKQALSDASFEDLALGTVISIFSMEDITIESELDLLAVAENYFRAMKEKESLNAKCIEVDNVEHSKDDKKLSIADSNDSKQNEADKGTVEPQEITSSNAPLGGSQSEATFRFTVQIRELTTERVLSPPCYVRSLPWKIIIKKTVDDEGLEGLDFFLMCDAGNESPNWSCNATAELRLISHKAGSEPFSRNIQHLFSRVSIKLHSKEDNWGFKSFMKWTDILDPNTHYIKDDSITLEVHVTAEPPQGVSGKSKKLSYPDIVVKNQENITTSDTLVDRARSETTFRFSVHNLSDLEDRVLSSPCSVRNLPWRIIMQPNYTEQGQKLLGFYLQCNGDSKSISWSCEAKAELRLISQNANAEPFYGKFHRLFCGHDKDWGYFNFMAWNDVLDPEKGYVKDDAITLEVRVVAEPPQGLSWHSRDCISCIDNIKDESVQAVLRKIRFLTLTAKELADYVPKLSLLTDQDIAAIIMNIVSKDTKKPLPLGLSTSRIPRLRRVGKLSLLIDQDIAAIIMNTYM